VAPTSLRAQDGQHFYELELATEASGPQWAIWKDDNNNWSRLAGGHSTSPREKITGCNLPS
jgi:hypothetical protein